MGAGACSQGDILNRPGSGRLRPCPGPIRPAFTFATALITALWALTSAALPAAAQSADSLPAFRTDSASADPFHKVEAGQSPWAAPKAKTDTGFRADTVTAKLTHRYPSLSLWLGAEFSDLDAKENFKTDLDQRLKNSAAAGETLQVLQPFEEAHLSFPVGIQAVYPLGPWFDAVAMARFSWYKQNAVLAHTDQNKSPAGQEWYAVQSTLGGAGLRFYVPPALLSVTGSLGLYTQFLWLWNLGGSELYTQYGSARARLDPGGAGFELLFGLQQALTGHWQVAGALGFVKQDYVSDRDWSALLHSAAPTGNARWGSSSLQANLGLAYHFGFHAADSSAAKPAVVPAAPAAAALPGAPSSTNPSAPSAPNPSAPTSPSPSAPASGANSPSVPAPASPAPPAAPTAPSAPAKP
jgi:hypothetical protein